MPDSTADVAVSNEVTTLIFVEVCRGNIHEITVEARENNTVRHHDAITQASLCVVYMLKGESQYGDFIQ